MNQKAANNLFLKKTNRIKILQHLRRQQLSRADLARLTGLSRAAITMLTDDLMQQGFLLEMGTVPREMGRRPTLLSLNPERFCTFGVSIARDQILAGVVDFEGKPLETIRISTAGSANQVLDKIIDALNAFRAQRRESILGVGVIAPGPLDYLKGVILNPPNFEVWHGVKVCQHVKEILNLPVVLENNPNALAIAEMHYGKIPSFSSMMLLTVDEGIGAGIILHHQLYRGSGGFGSEVGHMSIDRNGPRCACGNFGCLEVFAARPAYLARSARLVPGRFSWAQVVDGAMEGDPACRALICDQADYLGLSISNVLNLLEVEAVVLSGDMVYRPELLLLELSQRIANWSMSRNKRKVFLRASSLPQHSEILSAAAALMERYFNGELELSI